MELKSKAIYAARKNIKQFGPIVDPIVLATTFARAKDGENPDGYIYARAGNPNRSALEEAMAVLESGAKSFAFSSGAAAICALCHLLKPGDHVIAPNDLYHGTKTIFSDVFSSWGLLTTFVDMRQLENVEKAFKPTTRFLWIETPSNPMLKIYPIEALAELARSHGALSVVDNTVATPVLQNPLKLGCDFVVHSTTKAVGGHSDVMGGVVVARVHSDWTERLALVQTRMGAILSPFDSWLTLRGIKTLPIRVRAMSQSALSIAKFLQSHPQVDACHYPGLESHPDHELALNQMPEGFGCLLSFQVRGGKEKAMKVIRHLDGITYATSLGGVESLIEHRASIEPPGSKTPENLLRMSVGLESDKDLIVELGRALES